jgi:hypothetical protein
VRARLSADQGYAKGQLFFIDVENDNSLLYNDVQTKSHQAKYLFFFKEKIGSITSRFAPTADRLALISLSLSLLPERGAPYGSNLCKLFKT